MLTASIPGSASASASVVHGWPTSARAARRAVLSVSRPISARTSKPAARSAGTWTRRPKPVPTTATPGGRLIRRAPPARGSDAVELEHLDRVAPQHLVRDLLVDAHQHLLDVLVRVRPRRVGVRVVGLEADVVLADLVERAQTVAVRGEAPEDPPVVVGRRRLGDPLLGVVPAVVLVPDGVGAFEGVGCLLYTSDAADDLLCVDLGGRRIIKKKKKRARK